MNILDAGHGWTNTGAASGGMDEQAINWIYVNQIYRALGGKNSSSVCLTRPNPFSNPTLAQRVKLSNSYNTDLFISVHCNAFPSSRKRGIEVYYYKHSSKGPELATVMCEKIMEETDAKKCRPLPGSYTVIRKTRAWALLLELGYLTNPSDRKLLRNITFSRHMVNGIVRGIGECMKVLGKVERINHG